MLVWARLIKRKATDLFGILRALRDFATREVRLPDSIPSVDAVPRLLDLNAAIDELLRSMKSPSRFSAHGRTASLIWRSVSTARARSNCRNSCSRSTGRSCAPAAEPFIRNLDQHQTDGADATLTGDSVVVRVDPCRQLLVKAVSVEGVRSANLIAPLHVRHKGI